MIIVLKRFRVGEFDIIARVYGYGGIMSLYVKDYYIPNSDFYGIFEPFNVVNLWYRQSGQLIIPDDIIAVERLSYLAKDYISYKWMSTISLIILKHVRFYDRDIFNKLREYMLMDTDEELIKIFTIRFYLDLVKMLGIKPGFIDDSSNTGKIRMRDGKLSSSGDYELSISSINYIRRIDRSRNIERVRLDEGMYREIIDFFDRYLEYHMS